MYSLLTILFIISLILKFRTIYEKNESKIFRILVFNNFYISFQLNLSLIFNINDEL
jgi:hypothetical protein